MTSTWALSNQGNLYGIRGVLRSMGACVRGSQVRRFNAHLPFWPSDLQMRESLVSERVFGEKPGE